MRRCKLLGLALLAAAANLWGDAPLQPNAPVTKDGITVAVRCVNSCTTPPAQVQISFGTDAKWRSELVYVVYLVKTPAGYEARGHTLDFPSNIFFWEAPTNITTVVVLPAGPQVAFFGESK